MPHIHIALPLSVCNTLFFAPTHHSDPQKPSTPNSAPSLLPPHSQPGSLRSWRPLQGRRVATRLEGVEGVSPTLGLGLVALAQVGICAMLLHCCCLCICICICIRAAAPLCPTCHLRVLISGKL